MVKPPNSNTKGIFRFGPGKYMIFSQEFNILKENNKDLKVYAENFVIFIFFIFKKFHLVFLIW